MGWKINFWARIHDGDHAYLLFRNLLKRGTNPNLFRCPSPVSNRWPISAAPQASPRCFCKATCKKAAQKSNYCLPFPLLGRPEASSGFALAVIAWSAWNGKKDYLRTLSSDRIAAVRSPFDYGKQTWNYDAKPNEILEVQPK